MWHRVWGCFLLSFETAFLNVILFIYVYCYVIFLESATCFAAYLGYNLISQVPVVLGWTARSSINTSL